MSNTVKKKKFSIGRRVYFVDRIARPYPALCEEAIRSAYENNSTFYYDIARNRSVNKRIVLEAGVSHCIPECDISFSKAEVYEKVIESLKEQIGGILNEVVRVSKLLRRERKTSNGA